MKVQTTVLLLCFLSGVFLSSVVHAKPSPALMKELIALEKYLEKKQDSDGADGQTKNQDDNLFENMLNNAKEGKNENSDNLGGEASKADQNDQKTDGNVPLAKPEEDAPPAKPEEGVPPVKPQEGVPPVKPQEGVPPAKPEEGVPPAKPEEGVSPQKPEGGTPENAVSAPSDGKEGENPQEGNGQVKNGRNHDLEVLDDVIRKFKDAVDVLKTLSEAFQKQFQNDDRRFKELEDKVEQAKEKTKESLSQLDTAVEDIKSTLELEKKSVQENAPARRSHLSDTEFLNIVHSLLTNN